MAVDLEHFPTSETAKRMMSRVSPIYDRSYVAKWLYQVMGLEWDAVRGVMESLWAQPFLEQATWGLRYWEQAYGLDTDETKTYEERRRLVSAKRSYKKPMNPARLEMMLSNLTGGSAVVTENIAAYTFRVELDTQGNPLDYDSVIRLIRQVKPSHQSLRLYIISTANVKIRPRIGKHRFPYRMTGEHPDINVWGSVERKRVDVATDGCGYPFPYPVTGPHLAGTIPEENTLGFIREAAAEVGAVGTGAVFPYTPAGVGVAGTLPDVNIPAHIRDIPIGAEASGEGRVFPYVQTGTKPEVNTAGYVRRSGVQNAAEASGTVFPYPLSGTRPEVNIPGGLGEGEIVDVADGHGAVFPYGPAGEAESGTQPDVRRSPRS